MPFQPCSDRHAIAEVVFGIRLEQMPTPGDVEKMISTHDKFREKLPRLTRADGFSIFIGDGPPPQQPPPAISFESYKIDGTHAWRLRLENNAILVNCLDYSRWAQVKEESLNFILAVSEPLFQKTPNM